MFHLQDERNLLSFQNYRHFCGETHEEYKLTDWSDGDQIFFTLLIKLYIVFGG